MEHTSSSLQCRYYRRWGACVSLLVLYAPCALGQMVLLPDDRVIVGTVTDIRSDQVQVRMDADDVEPRYLSAKEAQEKGVWPLKKGDRLHIVVNEQNTAVGYHRVGDEVRAFVQDKLKKLPAGKSVILLLDGENKVTDLAVPPVP